ncbi:hypothetical protein ACIBTV_25420 [Micromonospora sp. NPDC049366]|uniref:hypothetical protein n=1 Tax=Micromonospora sp. NPDC049366 TaxID=3364271 RepID=UPI003790EBAA
MSTRTSAGRVTARRGPVDSRIAAGTCRECGFVNATYDVEVMRCGGCDTRVRLTYVQGSHNAAQPCDSRCQYATGPVCSCACGGDNHRAGYIHVDLVPVWVRERDRARHTAKQAQAEQRRLTAEERKQARRAELLERHPELADLTREKYDVPGTREHLDGFLLEMFWAFGRGDMTDRQAAAAAKAIQGERRYAAKVAERQARDAQLRAAGVRVPTGRVTFKGWIVSVKDDVNRFSYHANTVWKCVIETDEGWRVHGALPRGLEPPEPTGSAEERDAILALWKGWHDRLPGREVTIRAELSPSDDDPLFGFFKRPKLVAAGPLRAPGEPKPQREPVPAPVEAFRPDPWGPVLRALGV